MKKTRPHTDLYFAIFLGFILSSSSAAGAPFLTLPNGSVLYSTGINIDEMSRDLSYRLSSLAGEAVSKDVFMAGSSYLSSNDSDSAWISPFSPHWHVDDITLSVRTTLDLTGIDLKKNDFSLSGYWVSDNQGLDIIVNGLSTGQVNNGDHFNFPSSSSTNLFMISSRTSNLVEGPNQIEFLWGNGGAGGADPNWPNDPTHIRIEMSNYVLTPPCILCDGFESGNTCAWSESCS